MARLASLPESKLRNVREAWHGPMTREAVARRYAIGEKLVRTIWEDARRAGALPSGPRPHFADRSKPIEPRETILDDDSPIGDFNPTFEGQCIAFAVALAAHHHPADQVTPADWLRIPCEIASLKTATAAEINALVPSPAKFAAMCRAQDNAAILRRHLDTVPA